MKTVKNIALVSSFIMLLLSCKTVKLERKPTIYPNRFIDSSIQAEPRYVQEISPYKVQLESIMNQSISYAEEDFTKTGYSSNLGNLLADLVLDYSKKHALENNTIEPEFCLLNLGGVRTIIPKGGVTVGSIFEVSPFENELVFVQLDGSQMKEMFDYLNAEKKGHPLAGIKIIYKNNTLYSAKIRGKDFDSNQKYTVVTINYLKNGGDKMDFFGKSTQAVDTHIKLRETLIEQVKKYKVLPESKEERLIFEN